MRNKIRLFKKKSYHKVNLATLWLKSGEVLL